MCLLLRVNPAHHVKDSELKKMSGLSFQGKTGHFADVTRLQQHFISSCNTLQTCLFHHLSTQVPPKSFFNFRLFQNKAYLSSRCHTERIFTSNIYITYTYTFAKVFMF